MKLILLLILGLNLIAAQDSYSLRVAVGQPTLNSAADIAMGNFGTTRSNLRAYNLDGGYLLARNLFDLPIDLYLKGGLTYYEDTLQDNVYGADLYVKIYYNVDFWQNRVRFGLGEGASYTSRILEIEQIDAQNHNDNNSHYLNYLDISLDFDLGKLTEYKALNETYIGVLLKHRSGIFGLIHNVSHGGSNYESVYIEKNF